MATEFSGTLSNSAATIPANINRRGLVVCNNSDTVMTVRMNGQTASASVGIPVGEDDALWLTPEMTGTGAVSVFCAGDSKAYTAYEW